MMKYVIVFSLGVITGVCVPRIYRRYKLQTTYFSEDLRKRLENDDFSENDDFPKNNEFIWM